MTSRRRLPNRRFAETVNFCLAGQNYVTTVGFFPDDGTVAEIFVNSEKSGSMSDIIVADAALAVSLALQYGAPFEVLRDGMKRDKNGVAQGPIGAALDAIRRMK